MAFFQNPFFKSSDHAVEVEYNKGVMCIQSGMLKDAVIHLERAAQKGHASALYNLSIIHASGKVSPWNFDIAADCWYKAAQLEHPSAKRSLWLIEAADRGGFGYDHLVKFTLEDKDGHELNGAYMTCAARFTSVLCKVYGATNDVIAYEIDAARQSDDPDVQDFVARTGISEEISHGGLGRLIEGSAADQITDGLNQFSVAQKRSGLDEKLVQMARCSIVGYVIQKSIFGARCEPLLGLDRFFL